MKKQLLALAGALMLSTANSSAAVIVEFRQVGADVTATWTGSLSPGNNFQVDLTTFRATDNTLNDRSFIAANVGASIEFYIGGQVESLPVVKLQKPMVSGAVGWGFQGATLFLPGTVDGMSDYMSSPFNFDSGSYVMTIENRNLAQIGADSFSNTLAWTSSSGDTISYTTIPEPSSALLLGFGFLCLLGLAVRRKR